MSQKLTKNTITIEGITYPSRTLACNAYGVVKNTVRSHQHYHNVSFLTAFFAVCEKKIKDEVIAKERRTYKVKDTPIDYFCYRLAGRNITPP